MRDRLSLENNAAGERPQNMHRHLMQMWKPVATGMWRCNCAVTGFEADRESNRDNISNHCHTPMWWVHKLLAYLPSNRAHEELPVEIGAGNIERRSHVP